MTKPMKWITGSVAALLLLVAGYGVLSRASGGAAGGSTTGQTVNAAIDNLAATGVRLMELPVFMLLAGAVVLGAGLAALVSLLATQSRRVTINRAVLVTLSTVVVFGLALIVDRKMGRLESEVGDLRTKLRDQRMAMIDVQNEHVQGASPALVAAPEKGSLPSAAGSPGSPAISAAPRTNVMAAQTSPPKPGTATPAKNATKRDVLMFDVDKVQRTITSTFGPINFRPVIYDEATDVVEVRISNPPIVAYMAIVDLRTPGLEVKFGGSLDVKTYTSEFARTNDCGIAINGEAGSAPQANSGLGVWTGNMITQGKAVLKELPNNKRPFLSFDKQSRATFTAMAASDRSLGADPYNVIWGRLDAVTDGVVQTEAERDRQPRTAMGIDKEGTHLYLMVVDGRQQQYSVGFTRGEVGMFMQAFGTYNGMLCDEGGSSCMYMKKFGGIVNSPSDGEERPTYTHFGISLRGS